MPRQQPERAEQQQIIRAVRAMGGGVWAIGTTRRRGDHPGTMMSPGIADLWIVLPERFTFPAVGLFWEVKATGGKRTPEQVAFGDACLSAGVAYGYGTAADFLAWLLANNRVMEAC